MALSFTLWVAVTFNQSWLRQRGRHDGALTIFTPVLEFFRHLFDVQTLFDKVMLGLERLLLDRLDYIAELLVEWLGKGRCLATCRLLKVIGWKHSEL